MCKSPALPALPALALTLGLVAVGCASPVAPTPAVEGVALPAPAVTSRVDPDDLPAGLTLDDDPRAEGVSVCRTLAREYCSADGSACSSEIDFYTVVAPETCPVDPIP